MTTTADVTSRALDVAADHKQKLNEAVNRMREVLEIWAKKKIQSMVEKVVDKIPGIVKKHTEDPEMPSWVASGKDAAIDGMWPDFKSEIMWEVAVFLDKSEEEPAVRGPNCVTAFLRYHMQPFDKSFWGQMRDPWHILFMLIPLIPVYGVTPLWFAFVFCVIDKSDEFQLVKFILGFKGTAFISQGIIRAVTGFIIFLGCVTLDANDSEHRCESSGPGTGADMWPTTAGFVFQIVLVWLAFIFLRCSKEKGRSTLKGTVVNHADVNPSKKGGYIIYLLWYDLACFVLCMGVVCFAVSTRPSMQFDDWPVHHALFGAQVLYGLLSAPFFVFTLPLLDRLLTHVLPTAYDQKGVCRKRVRPKKPRKPTPEPLVSEEEVQELYKKMKSILMGPA